MAKEISGRNKLDVFLRGFLSGLGWMLGATLGFAVLGVILKWLGGLPVIGSFIATLVELTNQALETKKTLH